MSLAWITSHKVYTDHLETPGDTNRSKIRLSERISIQATYHFMLSIWLLVYGIWSCDSLNLTLAKP